MRIFTAALVCMAGSLTALPALAIPRGQNLVRNPGFETDADWAVYGSPYVLDSRVAHSGRQSLRLSGETLASSTGAKQVLTFDPPLTRPFRVAAWSRAQGAEVGQDYNVYLDLHYADGTPLWGQKADFNAGTHDWQYAEHTFEVAKPVASIEVHVLFRQAKGT
ncbi:MAG: hypothetical protein HYU66_11405, partial [Armatimonadetes bacterium]|nr:hypothetical protein [Armatimonadota bacterium]